MNHEPMPAQGPVDVNVRHTPRAHAKHKDGVPCGCWTGEETERTTSCPMCGATYQLSEVLSFLLWRCYDCSAGWFTSPAPKYQKRGPNADVTGLAPEQETK